MPRTSQCPFCRAGAEHLSFDGTITSCKVCGSIFELVQVWELRVIHQGKPRPAIPRRRRWGLLTPTQAPGTSIPAGE